MSVFDEFQKTVTNVADKPFIHIPGQAAIGYSASAIDFSYRQAQQAIRELQHYYQSAGYGYGQRVAVVLDNRAEFFLHFLALNSLGISVVPVNSGFSARETAYVINHSDACLVVSLPEHVPAIRSAMGAVDSQFPIIASSDLENLATASVPTKPGSPDDKSEVAVLYTSGTTGEPKGCMLSNQYFFCMGDWYVNIGGYCALEYGRERLLTPLPLVHMNALCSMMGMIMSGGCIIQLDRFHATTWWDTVRESRATCLHYLGVIPAILLNQAESPEDDFSHQVKFGFGAGVDPKHRQRFEKRFGFPLIEGWAMTETGTYVCIVANEEPRHIDTRSVGRAPDCVDYRLVDEEGHDVQPGQPGELLIRARGDDPRRGFFSGYYKNPVETGKVWQGGYFHTGDILRVGEDGSFYFVDRKKNIIRRSGENIAAVEVENVLFQHPDITNCAVTPVYDELRGEEVCACIVLDGCASTDKKTAANIYRFCEERLIYYKLPGYFIFLVNLPMTASQKIQRGEVKKLAAKHLDKGEYIDLRELKQKQHRNVNTE